MTKPAAKQRDPLPGELISGGKLVNGRVERWAP